MSASNKRSFVEDRKAFWNQAYTTYKKRKDQSPVWLEAYGDTLSAPSRILDMGCGLGTTTEYLNSKGHSVIATDISDAALARLRSRIPGVETKCLDFSNGLPWRNESFNHVVADLCLHYFDIDTTKAIGEDIFRVLKPGGFLFARVNSIKDTVHGYGQGTEVQANFFVSDGHFKRFFDPESIKEIFKLFDLVNIAAGSIDTSRGRKHLYEIAGKKPG